MEYANYGTRKTGHPKCPHTAKEKRVLRGVVSSRHFSLPVEEMWLRFYKHLFPRVVDSLICFPRILEIDSSSTLTVFFNALLVYISDGVNGSPHCARWVVRAVGGRECAWCDVRWACVCVRVLVRQWG